MGETTSESSTSRLAHPSADSAPPSPAAVLPTRPADAPKRDTDSSTPKKRPISDLGTEPPPSTQERRCENCNTSSTGQWRYGSQPGKFICSACEKYYRQRKKPRPPALWKPGANDPPPRCANCDTEKSSRWCVGSEPNERLCAACARHLNKYGVQRPKHAVNRTCDNCGLQATDDGPASSATAMCCSAKPGHVLCRACANYYKTKKRDRPRRLWERTHRMDAATQLLEMNRAPRVRAVPAAAAQNVPQNSSAVGGAATLAPRAAASPPHAAATAAAAAMFMGAGANGGSVRPQETRIEEGSLLLLHTAAAQMQSEVVHGKAPGGGNFDAGHAAVLEPLPSMTNELPHVEGRADDDLLLSLRRLSASNLAPKYHETSWHPAPPAAVSVGGMSRTVAPPGLLSFLRR